jgi:hypothetical protein
VKIVFFERPGGALWADYDSGGRKVVRYIEAHTRAEIEDVIKSPGPDIPDRVKALAERALKELLARNQQPEPAPPAPEKVVERGFFGRLRYVLTGR